MPIDQHGQVARGHRFDRDHGTASGHAGERAAGSPQKSSRRATCGSTVGSASSASSSGSSVTTTVSDQAHDPTAARRGAPGAGAASPRTGSTSPGSRGTNQDPSASSTDGKHNGEEGRRGLEDPEGIVVDVPRVPTLHHVEASGASPRCAAEPEGHAEGETQIARTLGPGRRPSMERPSRQLAASNDWSAGAPAKRWSSVAVSARPRRGRAARPDRRRTAGRACVGVLHAGRAPARQRSRGRARAAQEGGRARRDATTRGRRHCRPLSRGAWAASGGRRRRHPSRGDRDRRSACRRRQAAEVQARPARSSPLRRRGGHRRCATVCRRAAPVRPRCRP